MHPLPVYTISRKSIENKRTIISCITVLDSIIAFYRKSTKVNWKVHASHQMKSPRRHYVDPFVQYSNMYSIDSRE